MYVLPDTPERERQLAAQRKWAPLYEDNLPAVYAVLKRRVLKGEASAEERAELREVEKALGHFVALDAPVALALLRSANKRDQREAAINKAFREVK